MIALKNFESFLRAHWRPVERLSPAEWCARHLTLPVGGVETEPGRVNFERSPYLVEPLNALTDVGVTDVFFAAPTRIGKTFLLRMVFAYSVGADPAPMLWVDSTIEKGRSLVRKELIPLVECNPILAARKPVNRHHFSTQEMLFPGAAFNIYGANSEAQVSGDTVKRVLGNEVGKWKGASEKEAAILELVRHRTESFDDERRHYFGSTPTTEDDIFWIEMERGDMRVWFVPCPMCAHEQALVWENVVWSSEARKGPGQWDLSAVRDTARYKCVQCSGLWDDTMRLAAIQDARAHWRATQDGTPGIRSYHLNGLYGRRKASRLGELAKDFLSARQVGFITDRQDFWNSRMGMPWKDSIVEITVKKLSHLERPYLRGSLPESFKPDLVIFGVDVQTNGLPWICRAFNWSGESHLIDHGFAAGWADIDSAQADYAKLGASHVIIDCNFEDRRPEVLEQVWQRREKGWLAADGVEFSRDRAKLEKANVFMGGKLQGAGYYVPKLVISTYDFKRELELRFAGEIQNWWLYQLQIAAEPQEIDEFAEYKRQLLDEVRQPRKRRRAGLPSFEYRARTGNNHMLDCEVYALALFWVRQRRKSFAQRAKGQQPARRTVEVRR